MSYINIYCLNLKKEFRVIKGLPVMDLYQQVASEIPFQPYNCKVNNLTVDLVDCLTDSCELEFIGLDDESGRRTYLRTLTFLLSMALKRLEPDSELCLEHSISKGYYCTIENFEDLDQSFIDRLTTEMRRLVVQNLTIERKYMRADDAMKLFDRIGAVDKVDLIRNSGYPYQMVHSVDQYYDMYYGSLAPSTGYITAFDLQLYGKGFLLRMPFNSKQREFEPLEPQDKLQKVFDRHDQLLEMLEMNYIGGLNKAINTDRISEVIQISEAVQEQEIVEIANNIVNAYNDGVRIILVSGPSSSGKTTFTKRLRIQLLTHFLKPQSISLDDYFVDRESTPLDENGEFDFESLYALDLEQFNKDLLDLVDNKKVVIPTFDFTTGSSSLLREPIQLSDRGIVLIEGIHALNPELVTSIPTNRTFKIYVSALTVVSLDAHNRIPTTDNRLIRRMVRDAKYRGYSAIDTIKRWPSVRRGEEKWVFPYQECADAIFNSAMVYELAVLRSHVEPLLREVPHDVPEYSEAQRLLRFVERIKYAPSNQLPYVSLIREFVGGSSFDY